MWARFLVIHILFWGVLVACQGEEEEKKQPVVDPTVQFMRESLQGQEALIETPLRELNDLYRENLEKTKTQYQKNGDLESALAVDAEMAAIEKGEVTSLPSGTDWRGLQKTYLGELAKRKREVDNKRTELFRSYGKTLESAEKDQTQRGNLQTALALREEREFVDRMLSKGDLIPVVTWHEKQIVRSIPDDALEFAGHHYKVFDEAILWTQARAFCEQLGGYLVCIESSREMDFLKSLRQGRTFLWIGGMSNDQGKRFEWINGSEMRYTNWRDNRPDNKGGVNYMVINRWDQWDDGEDFTGPHAFICEWD